MNERMNELALQAKELAEQAFREDNAKRFTVMEKFAELIIRECLVHCQSEMDKREIRKTFGVEE